MQRRLLFLWSSAADLALDGILGTLWFTLLITLLPTGLGLIPVFGVGIVLLWLAVRLAEGVRLVERRRAEALYGVVITPPPPSRRSANSGFAGWLGQVLLDTFSPVLWKGLLHNLSSLVLGLLFWVLLQSAVDLLVSLRREGIAPLLVVLAAVVALAVVVIFTYGAGLLDRELSRALLGASRTAALEQRVDVLQGARQGAVDAAATERQRIERDLHDGVQPRLVSVAMTLGMARAKFDSDPTGARALLDEAHRETKESITDLRHLARGIHPAVLADRGLDAALSAVAEHCTVPTSVRVDLPTRPSKETEAMLYFTVSEALTNVSKHSRATGCSVSVTQTPQGVQAVVFDNGVGGAALGHGGGVGLAGMSDRVRAAGGTLTVQSPAGGPTVLTVEAPCAF
ncbi:sensor histidine kinase [Herbiconiux liukaitaii]|uniref:sensor histidine kinase n=1 Tax=Herbiconiux liukaitaii TaxID=3342799 RepID=UPI0035BA7C2A